MFVVLAVRQHSWMAVVRKGLGGQFEAYPVAVVELILKMIVHWTAGLELVKRVAVECNPGLVGAPGVPQNMKTEAILILSCFPSEIDPRRGINAEGKSISKCLHGANLSKQVTPWFEFSAR